MLKRSLALVLLATLGGCATAPPSSEQPIVGGAAVARSVVLCRTTYVELVQRLGPPSRDGTVGHDRIVTWVVEWDPLVRYLGVLLDSRGVVVDRYWDVPTEVQWVPTRRCDSR